MTKYRLFGRLRRLAMLAPALLGMAGPALAQTAAPQAAPIAQAATAADTAAQVPAPTEQTWAIHGQSTVVDQGTLAFHSTYRGANSLDPASRGRETVDVTLYAGLRPWAGAELWINQEIDQGWGLSDTLGAAGFPSGEDYKVGKNNPYTRLQRAFLRQTINLGGERQTLDPDQNQLGGSQTANRLVITVGKFAATDVFDTNKYAHDPRNDFFNWSVVDAGSFDYAADAWGYTAGAALEWYQGRWTVRAAALDMSVIPNTTTLDGRFGQFQLVGELEERHQLDGQPGRLAVTGFVSRARMGDFAGAIAAAGGGVPDTGAVRRYRDRPGVSVNLEQQLGADLGLFARAGSSNGNLEPYEFTDIDQTVSAGVSLTGDHWGRKGDTVGLAGVVNAISKIHQAYLAAGGLGLLVGDGKLLHYGPERIVEVYYSAAMIKGVHVSFDGQMLDNPAYNRDRGPATVLAVRLHGQF